MQNKSLHLSRRYKNAKMVSKKFDTNLNKRDAKMYLKSKSPISSRHPWRTHISSRSITSIFSWQSSGSWLSWMSRDSIYARKTWHSKWTLKCNPVKWPDKEEIAYNLRLFGDVYQSQCSITYVIKLIFLLAYCLVLYSLKESQQ